MPRSRGGGAGGGAEGAHLGVLSAADPRRLLSGGAPTPSSGARARKPGLANREFATTRLIAYSSVGRRLPHGRVRKQTPAASLSANTPLQTSNCALASHLFKSHQTPAVRRKNAGSLSNPSGSCTEVTATSLAPAPQPVMAPIASRSGPPSSLYPEPTEPVLPLLSHSGPVHAPVPPHLLASPQCSVLLPAPAARSPFSHRQRGQQTLQKDQTANVWGLESTQPPSQLSSAVVA